MSEGLIYSVDRTPERTFETSRAVQVITNDDIRRANAGGLAELLEGQAGIIIAATHSGGAANIRGLGGKQILLLVDGVKVNNATWGGTTREFLNIVDLNLIDRVEIVRGVVSVLGTESLGGVVNIITKKGAPEGQSFGGSIGTRYASADSSFSAPLEIYGTSGALRYNAGIAAAAYGDLHAGGAVGKQDYSALHERSGYLSSQYLLSPEKTIGLGYQNLTQQDVETPGVAGVFQSASFEPRRFQLASLSYQDLTSRSWEDSLRITASWNRQQQLEIVTVAPGRAPVFFSDADILATLNFELGTFVGRHHLIYGIDTSTDSVESEQYTPDLVTGLPVFKRGNNMDGAKYRTIGAYLQDRVDVANWLTVIAGARYGQFRSKGDEVVDLGTISIDNQQSDVTGALNLIAHVTPTLNVVANAFRGFRAPNIDDMSHYNFVAVPGGIAFQVPSAGAEPEHVNSYELGLKYDNGRLGGSAYVFRNKLTNLLVLSPGTYNGLPFRDSNGNGVKDPGEFTILQNQNIGSSTMKGIDIDAHYALPNGFSVWANYADTEGTDTKKHVFLSQLPPAFGTGGLRYLSSSQHRPWAELIVQYYGSQEDLGPSDLGNPEIRNGVLPGFKAYHIRGGLAVTQRFSFTAAVENLSDRKYRQIGSTIYAPGRQLVLGTRFEF